VLSIFELRANKVQVTEQLCVEDVCVTADDLRALLNTGTSPEGPSNPSDGDSLEPEVTPQPLPEPVVGEVPTPEIVPSPETVPEPVVTPEPVVEEPTEPVPEPTSEPTAP
jgi:hypothetical protein